MASPSTSPPPEQEERSAYDQFLDDLMVGLQAGCRARLSCVTVEIRRALARPSQYVGVPGASYPIIPFSGTAVASPRNRRAIRVDTFNTEWRIPGLGVHLHDVWFPLEAMMEQRRRESSPDVEVKYSEAEKFLFELQVMIKMVQGVMRARGSEIFVHRCRAAGGAAALRPKAPPKKKRNQRRRSPPPMLMRRPPPLMYPARLVITPRRFRNHSAADHSTEWRLPGLGQRSQWTPSPQVKHHVATDRQHRAISTAPNKAATLTARAAVTAILASRQSDPLPRVDGSRQSSRRARKNESPAGMDL
jgi:hypothetical protein